MPRPFVGAVLLSVCLASAGRAQTDTEQTHSGLADVLVLDHDFTGEHEFLRVFLQGGQVYRAELSSPDVTLELLGVARSTQLPRIYPFLTTDTPSGTSIVEIYPDADAEYEIRSIGRTGSGVATRMRLYRSSSASRRRQEVRNTPSWEVGVELVGGWHSGFVQSSSADPLAGSPAAGTDVETCFSARNGPEIPRLGWCVLGIGYQSQTGARSIVWFYTEPRLRILGRVRPGQSNWEMGALLRFGLGSISESSETPTVLAPGVYVARHIRNRQGAGWSLQASYSRARFKGFSRPWGAEENLTPQSNRFSLGVGWYK